MAATSKSSPAKPGTRSLLQPADFAAVKSAIDSHGRYLKGQPGGLRANFSHLDLSNFGLEGVDLSQAELTGARLQGAFLSEARFDNAVLYGADLRDCDLRRASLVRADLRGARRGEG